MEKCQIIFQIQKENSKKKTEENLKYFSSFFIFIPFSVSPTLLCIFPVPGLYLPRKPVSLSTQFLFHVFLFLHFSNLRNGMKIRLFGSYFLYTHSCSRVSHSIIKLFFQKNIKMKKNWKEKSIFLFLFSLILFVFLFFLKNHFSQKLSLLLWKFSNFLLTFPFSSFFM